MTRIALLLTLTLSSLAGPPLASAQPAEAPSTVEEPSERLWHNFDRPRLAVLAGLIQPLVLQGGNVEVDLYYGRLVIGYSHGFLLNVRGEAVVGEAAEQGLEYRLPYSTGLSVGYRFLDWLDMRIEAKIHQFDVREAGSTEDLFSYTTFTLGFGAYAQYRPFYDFGVSSSVDEWLHGFMILGSFRFWPNVWTSLPADQITYRNAAGEEAVHRAANVGIANSPFIVNLAIGYAFTI